MSIYELPSAFAFFVALAAVVGLILGSFLNCAASRIVRGENFITGRSHCMSCGHELTPLELIPVLSWVIQKGRCKSCGAKISWRYPLTELCFSLLTVLCLLRFDLTVLCLRNYVFLCCLFLLTLTDIEEMIIPDGCLLLSVAAFFLAEPFVFAGWGSLALRLLAAVVFGGGLLAISLYMDKRLGRDSLGGGDIKLFAVTGLYLGLVGTLFAMIAACLGGLLFYCLTRGRAKTREFPFGPWIALGAAFMLLFGEPMVSWYIGLL